MSNFSVAQIERFRRAAQLHAVQPPYNLFERELESELLPYCRNSGLGTVTYGAMRRGLLSGKRQENAEFGAGALRRTDPKFRAPRYAQYLAAVHRLDRFARENYGKRVLHLAVRWLLDQGVTTALSASVITTSGCSVLKQAIPPSRFRQRSECTRPTGEPPRRAPASVPRRRSPRPLATPASDRRAASTAGRQHRQPGMPLS